MVNCQVAILDEITTAHSAYMRMLSHHLATESLPFRASIESLLFVKFILSEMGQLDNFFMDLLLFFSFNWSVQHEIHERANTEENKKADGGGCWANEY